MGLNFPAQALCDRCGAPAPARLVVTKLNPPTMHVSLPVGWTVGTKMDSQELIVQCPKCPPGTTSIPPAAIKFPEGEDPSTGPTMRPPPSSK